MKRMRNAALLVAMLTICLLIASFVTGAASEFIYKDVTYYIKDGKAYVTDITATAVDVVVPAKIGDYEVCVDEFRIGDSDKPESLTFEEGINMDTYDLWRSGPIKKLSLPSSVIYIDPDRITAIGTLEEIEIHKDNKVYTSIDGVLFDKEMTKIICYPCAKEGESYKIPDSVKTVGPQAFYNTKIVSLDLGNGLETIERSGFNSMKQLKNIVFGDSLKTVETGAFMGCTSLEKINIPAGVSKIGDIAFKNTGLKELNLPVGIESVGHYAFSECKTLTKVYMPSSVNDYGNGYTFNGCVNLTEVTFAEGAKVLAYGMFANCTGLKKINIPSSVEELPTEIFFACTALEEVTLNEGLKCIKGRAFANCNTLKDIRLPDSLEKIVGEAFKGCKSIEKFDIPDNVADVYAAAFTNCTSLKTINLGEKAKASGNFNSMGSDKFEGFTVDEKNENHFATDGVLYSGDKATLICYPKAKSGESFEVPAGAKSIGAYAFYSQLFLKTATLPEGVTEIQSGAFNGCKGLETVKLPDTIEKNCSSGIPVF